MGDVENFEQEMNDLENWGADPASNPTPDGGQGQDANQGGQTQSQVAEFWRKAGGREWKSPDELGKAYDGLLRVFSKKENEFKKYREQMSRWEQFQGYLGKNPDLQKEFVRVAQEYHKRMQAGQSPTTAQKQMDLPPEIAQKLERFEAYLEDKELEKEINDVKSKYNLDENQVRMVLERAKALNGVPLELAYKDIAFESGFQKAKAQGIEEAKKQKEAGAGAAAAPAVTPAPKTFTQGYDKSWRQSALKTLEGFGLQ